MSRNILGVTEETVTNHIVGRSENEPATIVQLTPQQTAKQCKIEILKNDEIPAFGAFCAGSYDEGAPTILLNVGSCLLCSVTEEDVPFKTLVLEVLMHEFGHMLEEWLQLEFDEDRLEAIITSYQEAYGSPEVVEQRHRVQDRVNSFAGLTDEDFAEMTSGSPTPDTTATEDANTEI